MTSKILFSKMVRKELRQMSWMAAVSFLVFGLLIPFRVLLVMTAQSGNLGRAITYSYQDKMDVFCRNVGFGRVENTLFILLAGILCAYGAFQYLFSPAKLDFYHSLPVKREKLFAVKVTASFCAFAVPYLISQLLTLPVGMIFGVFSGEIFLETAVASLQGLLFFLCSYSGALLAVMLSGKMLTAVLATGTLGLYLPALIVITEMLRQLFMDTLLPAKELGRSEILRNTSPWGLCLFPQEGGRMGNTGVWPSAKTLCVIVAVTVLLLLICLQLYRIRRTEVAQEALAFRKLEHVVKLLLTVPAAVVAAGVAYELYESPIWELIFLLVFGTLGCLIMEAIYRWDIRQSLMHKRHILLTILLASVFFFSVRFDVTGYDTYLPEKDEIAAMAAKSWAENLDYSDENGERIEEVYSRKLLTVLETETFDPLYRLAQEGVKNEKETVLRGDVTRIIVKYRLKNGKEVYRSYWAEKELYDEVMNEMTKDPEYQKQFYPIMDWSEERVADLQCSFNLSAIVFPDLNKEENYVEISIPAERMQDVTQAYRKDLENVGFREVWNDEMMLYFQDEEDRFQYPMNRSMTNTVKLLREIAEEEFPEEEFPEAEFSEEEFSEAELPEEELSKEELPNEELPEETDREHLS